MAIYMYYHEGLSFSHSDVRLQGCSSRGRLIRSFTILNPRESVAGVTHRAELARKSRKTYGPPVGNATPCPAKAGRKPNRKMAFSPSQGWLNKPGVSKPVTSESESEGYVTVWFRCKKMDIKDRIIQVFP